MYLTIDNNSEVLTILDPPWTKVEESLKQIDPTTKCYFILTSDSGSYIQCAGSKETLTIELRETKDDTFKHYVIGKGDGENSLGTVWQTIDCRVGPIRVHGNEVLDLNDAVVNFKWFFSDSKQLTEYRKRNVSKGHQS